MSKDSSSRESFPHQGSARTNFSQQLNRLNEEFMRMLSDYDGGKGSITYVHAAAYNLYCFVQDNHAWLNADKGTLDSISKLLSPSNKSNEKEAVKNFRMASDTINKKIA